MSDEVDECTDAAENFASEQRWQEAIYEVCSAVRAIAASQAEQSGAGEVRHVHRCADGTTYPCTMPRPATPATTGAGDEDDLLHVIDQVGTSIARFDGIWISGHALRIARAVLADGWRKVGVDEVVVNRHVALTAAAAAEASGFPA